MSRMIKKPITIPAKVDITITGQTVQAKGPQGSASYLVPDFLALQHDNEALSLVPDEKMVLKKEKARFFHALAGTTRANLENMIKGVVQGYQKALELHGVGFRGQLQEGKLTLTVGFASPVVLKVPADVTVEVNRQTEIVVSGIDKQRVGQFAASIRDVKPVEPYKGKGIRYRGEKVILKETKKK